ncbi:MAG: imidazole glycerol phosphate synthase subunit HisH [Candidatus Micrarchaeota archaeon]
MTTAIIDYGMGNAQSVINAIESINHRAILTNRMEEIQNADRIILPGVGAFPKAMDNLKRLGLLKILKEEVREKKKPFLGICLGMQLLAKKGYEVAPTAGLGWIDAEVKRFEFTDKKFKIPHMGWDDVTCNTKSNMFMGASEKQTFYFVHSYYVDCNDKKIVVGECDYGIKFTAAIEQENIFGAQFHPEKSQKDGLDLLKRFVEYDAQRK